MEQPSVTAGVTANQIYPIIFFIRNLNIDLETDGLVSEATNQWRQTRNMIGH